MLLRFNVHVKYIFLAKELNWDEEIRDMVRKVIIPAAGLGTRLFPATKEQPKEMLPIFAMTANGDMSVKPVVQMVFEQLYDAGLREFSMWLVGENEA